MRAFFFLLKMFFAKRTTRARGESGKKGKKRQKEREREIFSLTTVRVFRARCKNAANKQEGCARVDSISPHKRKKLAIFDHFLCQARGADDDWL